MQSEELKKIQSPIKEKYRSNPESALLTLKAEGRLGEGVSCKIDTGKALMEAGLHPAAGGNGMLVCSGDMLLEALVACAGVTLSAVTTSIGLNVRDGVIKAEGDLDFRGTLAVSKEAPVGFSAIRLSFVLDCDCTPEQLEIAKKLTERYCIVYQTLVNGVSVETNFETK
jgi:uncharacterized OsmC-like protein